MNPQPDHLRIKFYEEQWKVPYYAQILEIFLDRYMIPRNERKPYFDALKCERNDFDEPDNPTLYTCRCNFKGLIIENEWPTDMMEVDKLVEDAIQEELSIKETEKKARLKSEVFSLLLSRKRDEATEEVVEYIKDENKIYTTRNDSQAEMWIYREGVYVPQGRTYIKELCRDVFGDVFSTHIVNTVINKIEADTFIDADKFFENRYVDEIAIQNGILNLKTKKLDEFSPDKIFFNKLPIKYQPEKECPHIQEFISGIIKNEEDIPVIQEMIGFCLLKEYKYEKAFMLLGSGRNGKGKFIELVKRLLGPDNCCNIPIQNMTPDSFNICELHNKLANIGADIDAVSLKNTGMFKSLTGRDTVSAQRKFLNMLHFVNYAKMIFCCNKLPRTYDTTMAFWNRWVLIEFPYTFIDIKEFESFSSEDIEKNGYKVRDTEIIEKIATEDEMSGFLNFALKGLDRLNDNGGFSYSKNTEDVREMWIRKSDSFEAFLMDYISEDYDNYISKKDLRQQYSTYCKKHEIKPVSDKSIKASLQNNYGVVEERRECEDGRFVWVWVGIRYKVMRPFDV